MQHVQRGPVRSVVVESERADHEENLEHGRHVDDPHRGHNDHGYVGPRGERAPGERVRIPASLAGTSRLVARADLIDMDGLGDVLQRLVAEVFSAQPELVPHLVPHGSGHADGAGVGEPLEARGDVNPLPVDPVALDHHVAEVNADAKLHPSVGRHVGVPGLESALDLDGAAGRVEGARKLREEVISW